MDDTPNPYQPPDAAVEDREALAKGPRPKLVTMLVCVYVSSFSIGVLRMLQAAPTATLFLAIVLSVTAAYVALISYGLYSGWRWARYWVLAMTVVSCIAFAGSLGNSGWNSRSGLVAFQLAINLSVAVMLMLPAAKKWYSRNQAA